MFGRFKEPVRGWATVQQLGSGPSARVSIDSSEGRTSQVTIAASRSAAPAPPAILRFRISLRCMNSRALPPASSAATSSSAASAMPLSRSERTAISASRRAFSSAFALVAFLASASAAWRA